jgi:large subunit ribosomal protein L10
MKKAEKTLFVDNLSKSLKAAKSVVLINFSGMSVKTQQELKKRLKEVGATMLVTKNTLFKRAGEGIGLCDKVLIDTILSGQTALIIGQDDPISPIQVLGKFIKEYDLPQLKVGIVENSFQDTESLIKISTLPGREALLGQILGSLMTPSYSLVNTLRGNLGKFIYILDQASQKN